jgi:hypothetical protein
VQSRLRIEELEGELVRYKLLYVFILPSFDDHSSSVIDTLRRCMKTRARKPRLHNGFLLGSYSTSTESRFTHTYRVDIMAFHAGRE